MTNFQFIRVHFHTNQKVALGLVESPVSQVSEINVVSDNVLGTFSLTELAGLSFLAPLNGSYDRYSREAEKLSSCPHYADWKIIEIPQRGCLYMNIHEEDTARYSRTGEIYFPTHNVPVGVLGDNPVTLEEVKDFLCQVGEGVALLRTVYPRDHAEVERWQTEKHASFAAATSALHAGDSTPMTMFYGRTPEDWAYTYDFYLGRIGPFGASFKATNDATAAAQKAAKAFIAAQDAAEKVRLEAARIARRAFQVRLADSLRETSPELYERAERGLLPPDELWVAIVGALAPSAVISSLHHREGVRVTEGLTLSKSEFDALRRIELELETSTSQARAWGVKAELRLGLIPGDYNDEEDYAVLLIRIVDTISSDWTREGLAFLVLN